jgi:hypothetical protein
MPSEYSEVLHLGYQVVEWQFLILLRNLKKVF